jgi:O-acetyl-ADP-ribose deacetylase (regulator of RNase III)
MPRTLPLSAYDAAIALRQPFLRPEPIVGQDRDAALVAVARSLRAESGRYVGAEPETPEKPENVRHLVRVLLTRRPPGPLPEEAEAFLDRILAAEAAATSAISAADLDPHVIGAIGRTRIALWQGDITRLAVDAIVNAANSALLGCFRPDHACIDNAIHCAAGPALREDCARIIAIQGHSEITGDAKLTRAYHLPARFVIHTVGPIAPSSGPRPEHERALKDAYESCLDVAAEAETIRAVAFCGISTGIFGYPKRPAAEIATRTVKKWILDRPDAMDLIVFNVFSADDLRVYEAVVPVVLHEAC